MMQKQPLEIKDRHTGVVLFRLPLRQTHGFRGVYLGHLLPKDFRSADFRGMDLSEASLAGRDLSDADLTGATLTGTKYDDRTRWPDGFEPERFGAVRVPLDLSGARVMGDEYKGADLSGVSLRGANLTGADLTGTDLSQAKLNGAKLAGANLTGANLTEAELSGASSDENTRWPEGFDVQGAIRPAKRAPLPSLGQTAELLKTLADTNRLRILGLLQTEELSGTELAALLQVSEPTVSHHVGLLKAQQLVTVRADGTRRLYRTDKDKLQAALQSVPAVAEAAAKDVDGRAFEDKVMRAYFDGDRLKAIPLHRLKKLHVVLRRLIREFDEDRNYPEREVNVILGRFHADFATLRRHLVDFRYMTRQNNVYRRSSLPIPAFTDADSNEE